MHMVRVVDWEGGGAMRKRELLCLIWVFLPGIQCECRSYCDDSDVCKRLYQNTTLMYCNIWWWGKVSSFPGTVVPMISTFVSRIFYILFFMMLFCLLVQVVTSSVWRAGHQNAAGLCDLWLVCQAECSCEPVKRATNMWWYMRCLDASNRCLLMSLNAVISDCFKDLQSQTPKVQLVQTNTDHAYSRIQLLKNDTT